MIVAFPRPFARASAPSLNRLPFPAAKPPRAGIPSPRKESFNPLIFAFGGAHCRGFLRETRGNLVGTLTPPPDAERNLFPTPPLEGLRGAGERVFRAARRRLGFSRPTLPPEYKESFSTPQAVRACVQRGGKERVSKIASLTLAIIFLYLIFSKREKMLRRIANRLGSRLNKRLEDCEP